MFDWVLNTPLLIIHEYLLILEISIHLKLIFSKPYKVVFNEVQVS